MCRAPLPLWTLRTSSRLQEGLPRRTLGTRWIRKKVSATPVVQPLEADDAPTGVGYLSSAGFWHRWDSIKTMTGRAIAIAPYVLDY